MIEAHHTGLADLVFRPYIMSLFRRHFYSIHLLGDIPRFDPALPLILSPNHSSWWDGFFVYLLNKKIIKRRAFLMMLEEQLWKNRFFRYLGAYSIDPASMTKTRESIDYTLDLIGEKSGPARMLCIFPQGELLPWGTRPLVFKKGLELIFKKIDRSVILCPLAMKIEFLAQQRPQVFFLFGECRIIEPGFKFSVREAEEEHENLLNELSGYITNRKSGAVIFRGRASVDEVYGRIRRRWLGTKCDKRGKSDET
jgi:hypothetical protein